MRVIIVMLLTGCLFLCSFCTGKLVQVGRLSSESNCYSTRKEMYVDPVYTHADTLIRADSTLYRWFRPDELQIARELGVLPLLNQLSVLHDQITDSGPLASRLDYLVTRQRLMERLTLISLEITSVSAELDCEEERADQIAGLLQQRESNLEQRLTVAAISIGAVAAIASGIIAIRNENSNAAEFIAIGAGITEAVLGVKVLTSAKRVRFYHPRNHLREIWEDSRPESGLFPFSVWRYVNQPVHSEAGSSTVRKQIVERWQSIGMLGEPGSREYTQFLSLLLGPGGIYTADQLRIRADMLDQLEAEINLMNGEIRMLMNKILQVFS
jgi:hypothetical protein